VHRERVGEELIMEIKKPPPSAAALQTPAKLSEGVGAPAVEKMTDIEKHVQGFIDIPLSKEKGEAVVTPHATQQVLEAMGIRVESHGKLDLVGNKLDPAGGDLLTKLFAKRQGHPGFVETDRLGEVGIREKATGFSAHSGTFDKKTGMIDAKKAATWWQNTSEGKGYITKDDVVRYLNGPGVDVLGLFALKLPGKFLNGLEFTLLFDLAAQVSDKGERVLTPDRFLAFLDGSLWRGLAEARASGTLYEPVKIGASMHGGSAGKVAMEMAKLTAAYGGPTDAGTMALHQAKLTIDTEASLKYQQAEKTLVPTLLGAVRALCPVGGASGLARTQAIKAPATQPLLD